MFKKFRDKIAVSGLAVLIVGVCLLVFTFISAYGFLTQSLSLAEGGDFAEMFGSALAPLIVTAIRVMYLGVMGWIGSLLTIRGVTLIANAPKLAAITVQPQPQAVAPAKQKPQPQSQPQPQKPKTEQPKKEPQPPEPELVVIPPEQIAQPQQVQQQEQQKNGQ